MRISRLLLVLGLIIFGTSSYVAQAQSSRDSDVAKKSSVESREFQRVKKASKHAYKKGMEDQKLEEYEELMKSNKKKYKKMAKGMKKPQYSNPEYFGHKKKPKKRPLGKRKFCEECGIIH